MYKTLATRKPEEQGFTLIELLVVIIIIGILAAIAVPIFLNQQKVSIAASMKSDVRNTNANVKTFLIKYPHATREQMSNRKKGVGEPEETVPSSGLYDIVVTHPDTTISVWGTWESYSIRAWNTTLDPDASLNKSGEFDFYFHSNMGKYVGMTDK